MFPVPAAEAGVFEPGTWGQQWFDLVQELSAQSKITALVQAFAMQSELVDQAAGVWHLRCESDLLGSEANTQKLQEALVQARPAGAEVIALQVQIAPTRDTPAKRLAHAQEVRTRRLDALVQADPLVQRLMRECNASVVAGSIRPIAAVTS